MSQKELFYLCIDLQSDSLCCLRCLVCKMLNLIIILQLKSINNTLHNNSPCNCIL